MREGTAPAILRVPFPFPLFTVLVMILPSKE
jgi:hypothetical protein